MEGVRLDNNYLNRSKVEETLTFILLVLVATISAKLSGYSSFISSTLLCIVIGMGIGPIFNRKIEGSKTLNFAKKTCLDLGVILLGTKLNILEILGLGKSVVLFVVFISFTNVVASLLMGKTLGLPRRLSAILGVGGMSCIVPAGEAVGANREEVGLAIGSINFSETIFLFLMPTLVASMNLTTLESSGIFTGVFHIMGYLVAASSTISEDILNYTIVLKMARLLTFAPIVIFLGSIFGNKGSKGSQSVSVPLFIKGFIGVSIVFTLFNWLDPSSVILNSGIKISSKSSSFLINIAMVAIGIKLNIMSLLKKAPKVILCVVLITIVQIFISLGAAKFLF